MNIFKRKEEKKATKLPKLEELRWDEFTAACSYFILHHRRDQRLPKYTYFHLEDFKYNEILNNYLESKGFDSPRPSKENMYIRKDGVTSWVPCYFPDENGGDMISKSFKAELIHNQLVSNLGLLEDISTKYCKGTPGKKLFQLFPNHVYFVRYGYLIYYLYYSLTNPKDDPLHFREIMMSDAVLSQFPESEDAILWWMQIISDLSQKNIIKKPNEIFSIFKKGEKFLPDKIPQFTQIHLEDALLIINFLTKPEDIKAKNESKKVQIIKCAECGNMLSYQMEECPKCGSSYKIFE